MPVWPPRFAYRERPDWYDDAACAGMGPSMFFSADRRVINRAKKVCAGCPVRVECLEEGRSVPSILDQGVRGGMTARERGRGKGSGWNERLPYRRQR